MVCCLLLVCVFFWWWLCCLGGWNWSWWFVLPCLPFLPLHPSPLLNPLSCSSNSLLTFPPLSQCSLVGWRFACWSVLSYRFAAHCTHALYRSRVYRQGMYVWEAPADWDTPFALQQMMASAWHRFRLVAGGYSSQCVVCFFCLVGNFGLHFLNYFQVGEAFLFRLFGLGLTQGGPDPPLFRVPFQLLSWWCPEWGCV